MLRTLGCRSSACCIVAVVCAARPHGPTSRGQRRRPRAEAPTYEASLPRPRRTRTSIKTFDMSNPEHEASELAELMEHGHVVEMDNKTAADTVQDLLADEPTSASGRSSSSACLLFLLSRLAWPKMLDGLQKREANIRTALEDGQQGARRSGQALRAEYQKEIDKAHAKVKRHPRRGPPRRQATTRGDDRQGQGRNPAERERASREIADRDRPGPADDLAQGGRPGDAGVGRRRSASNSTTTATAG